MTDLQRRLSRASVETARLLAPAPKEGSRRRWAVVESVTAGSPPTVTLDIDGTSVGPLRYLDTGVPLEEDDYVIAENVGGDMIVFGKMASAETVAQAPLYLDGDEKTATYTLVAGDAAGKVIEMNLSSAGNLYIPADGTGAGQVDWTPGTTIEVFQAGAGQVSILSAVGAGVLVLWPSYPSTPRTTGQYATAGLRYRGDNEWVVSGAVTT